MASIFSKYNQFITKKPLMANILTTGFLFGTGDYLAQTVTNIKSKDKLTKYDFQRTTRAIIYGSIIFAPIGDKWYKFLSKIKAPFIKRSPPAQFNSLHVPAPPKPIDKPSFFDTVAKVSVDQLIFAPIISIPLYYSIMTYLEDPFDSKSENLNKIDQKLKNNWWDTLKTNWIVWPAFQLFNFGFIPVKFNLLVVNIISIGWNCYLSLVLNDQDSDHIIDKVTDVKSEDQIMI